jgi:membrane protein DedA with SNARE-associated domain
MTTFASITAAIIGAATKVPLIWFVLGGSFLEEVFSPIPSYAIMVTAGSVARVQGKMWVWLVLFAVLGAFGKTIACLIYYTLADVFEDVFVPRFGKYFGVTHEDIEAMGARMGQRRSDHWLMIGLRALPVVPSVPISLVSGIIKVERRLFIWTTFIGTLIKNSAYLVIGYFGLRPVLVALRQSGVLRDVFLLGFVLCVGILIAWFVHHKRKN